MADVGISVWHRVCVLLLFLVVGIQAVLERRGAYGRRPHRSALQAAERIVLVLPFVTDSIDTLESGGYRR